MYLRKRMMINDILVCQKSASNVTITVENMADPACLMISYPHAGIPRSIPGVGMGSHIVFSKRLTIMGAVLNNAHFKYLSFISVRLGS